MFIKRSNDQHPAPQHATPMGWAIASMPRFHKHANPAGLNILKIYRLANRSMTVATQNLPTTTKATFATTARALRQIFRRNFQSVFHHKPAQQGAGTGLSLGHDIRAETIKRDQRGNGGGGLQSWWFGCRREAHNSLSRPRLAAGQDSGGLHLGFSLGKFRRLQTAA
ncbi:MAG: hypothetical protein ONB48_05670 [candidate division KSB1 bacterium]|nr:hypothetical protein [candidate division KSB1 bacterium]MDZ7273036.1 hypothetical protein [candidate division KSB1 bacterium]MDZ7285139.1 hypothetical protein [candidate division KSB1 bacterium]MDZ7298171.1 hypothetical protein [candidate division KSB1 bacterium]MDZ7307837.1 hypothetical protein [candidate division KSB1 bacterium]